MENSASIRAHFPGERIHSGPVLLAFLGPDEAHVAPLLESRRFGLLRRKDDLLAEGVAAVFGLAEGVTEPLALCFHAEKFTPTEAANWLTERGITPLLLIPINGMDCCRVFDAPLAPHVPVVDFGKGHENKRGATCTRSTEMVTALRSST
jgi:hypothetical protein